MKVDSLVVSCNERGKESLRKERSSIVHYFWQDLSTFCLWRDRHREGKILRSH